MKQNQHVIPYSGAWAVKGEGNSRITVASSRQADIINRAIQLAKIRRSEVVIHRRDGTIRDKDSYGKDPYPPRDWKH